MAYTYTAGNSTINNGGSINTTIGGLTSSPYLNTVTISGAGSSGIGGGAGQIYTTTGTGTANWVTPANPYDAVMKINQTNPPTIEVKGNMVINGRDLEERLNTIEKVLQIPERDVKLEKKHPKLKKLYDDYINALGKYRTFEAIKGDEDVA
jgi:hypothetical protein